MRVGTTIGRGPGSLDAGLWSRLRLGLGGSVAVHAVALGVWALSYEPQGGVPAPTERRAIKAVALTRMPRAEPVVEPEPEVSERQAEVAPPEEPDEITPSPEPRPGPPPPPAVCKGCAMMPASMGVPAPSKPSGKAVPWGTPGGVPGGVIGGVPGGVVGGVLGGDPSMLRGASVVPAKKTAPLEPLESVMQRAIYTPDPDPKRLARTRTAMFDRHDGVNRTAFCIDAHGKTVGVRTQARFPGDPQVDAICRQAVKAWRFQPFRVAGRPVRVCSVAVFEIEFE